MKWIKTLERYKQDSIKIEDKFRKKTKQDPITLPKEEEIEKEKQEISNSYVDDKGVVHIEDWDKY